jgi:Tfp pilus assembly pilus retraction ATPase PilT
MFTIKLFNNWEKEANKMVWNKDENKDFKYPLRKTRQIKINQQKQLKKLISTMRIIEVTPKYTVYEG